MKELSPDDRPREKLLAHGAAALGDNELVALVLGSGCRERDALAVANELLAAHGGLRGLVRSTADELGRRTLTNAPRDRVQLLAPRDTAAFLMPGYGGRAVERFGLVLLDTKYRVIRTTLVAVGTLNASVVQPRDVFREAAVGSAAAIIVFHNHPSGDPTPSQDDVDLTRRLAAAGTLLGIDVVDHIILGDARYCSFKELGKL